MIHSQPGPIPLHGDAVQLTTDTTSVTLTGDITSRGILRDGRGFAELTLPDADPEQRRDLEHTKRFQYELLRDGTVRYRSPYLYVREIRRRESDGALVVTGSP